MNGLAIGMGLLGILGCGSAIASDTYGLTLDTFNLNSSLDKVQLGEKLEFKQNLEDDFYYKVNGALYKKDHIGGGAALGYQFHLKKIMPYAEVNMSAKPDDNNKEHYSAGYNVGSKFKLSPTVTPYVEVDNPFIKQKTSAKIGSMFAVTKHIAVGGDYVQNVGRSGNGFDAKISYGFS